MKILTTQLYYFRLGLSGSIYQNRILTGFLCLAQKKQKNKIALKIVLNINILSEHIRV